jgi:hypothetical protein
LGISILPDNISAYPARQKLAALNELDVAQKAVNRFERPAAEVQVARAELAALKVHDADIASLLTAQ